MSPQMATPHLSNPAEKIAKRLVDGAVVVFPAVPILEVACPDCWGYWIPLSWINP